MESGEVWWYRSAALQAVAGDDSPAEGGDDEVWHLLSSYQILFGGFRWPLAR